MRTWNLKLRRVALRACLLVGVVLPMSAFGQSAGGLAYEARFNDSKGIEFKNGAALGADGSGVSGQPGDKAYTADAVASPGAMAVPGAAPAVTAAEELTVTAWYKPRAADMADAASLFHGFGSALLWDAKLGEWIWRVGSKPSDAERKGNTWYASGKTPPPITPGQWTFIAITWKRAENRADYYYGSGSEAVKFARKVSRDFAVDPASENKRGIGNDPHKPERAFNGDIDNVRFFTKALDPETLEKIRQADLKNQPMAPQAAVPQPASVPPTASAAPTGSTDLYQWSVTIDEVVARETKAPPRGFLWIPEQCQRVRAVVIAIQNMQEEQVFLHPSFRKTLSDLGLAIVWITPPMGSNNLRFDQGEDKVLESLLARLADVSGYGEIRAAPLVPLGHSASASWCWDVAAGNPQRTLAVLSLSGQWPYFQNEFWGGRSVDEVPGLTTKGEFEIQGSLEQGWYAGLKKDFFQKHPHAAFSHVVEPGDGHFAASDEKIELINLFLRKAVQYRLPTTTSADGAVALKPIDAGKTGWRYEQWRMDKAPDAPAAPVGQFKGKPDRSYWAFDQEMALAIEKFQATQRNKLNTLIGYRQQDGTLVQPRPDHLMMYPKFEPIDDTLTFKLTGGFFDMVPAATTKDGKPAGWQKMLGNYAREVEQGAPIPHPTSQDERLTIDPICGPVQRISPDTFALRFNRIGFDNPKRCSSICFIMTYPGDEKFKRMVQQGELKFPLKNTAGADQSITFPTVGDQKAGRASVKLAATSSANVPVFYYVREGPAVIEGDTLKFTPIPPRAKFPIKVTVVAWQWGRSAEPRLKSAQPVEQTFLISEAK